MGLRAGPRWLEGGSWSGARRPRWLRDARTLWGVTRRPDAVGVGWASDRGGSAEGRSEGRRPRCQRGVSSARTFPVVGNATRVGRSEVVVGGWSADWGATCWTDVGVGSALDWGVTRWVDLGVGSAPDRGGLTEARSGACRPLARCRGVMRARTSSGIGRGVVMRRPSSRLGLGGFWVVGRLVRTALFSLPGLVGRVLLG